MSSHSVFLPSFYKTSCSQQRPGLSLTPGCPPFLPSKGRHSSACPSLIWSVPLYWILSIIQTVPCIV
jgi:hypothetical protein